MKPSPITRCLSRSLLAGLLAGLLLCLAAISHAADEDTGYQPPVGAPFFLLSDAAYGSDEPARVRLQAGEDALAAIEEAGGVDIVLYRVERPLEFLRGQRNLHRIDLKAGRRGEGLANTLSYLWSQWWLRARQGWQNLFDRQLRTAVTAQAPALKTAPDIAEPPRYQYRSPYGEPSGTGNPSSTASPSVKASGLTDVERFRYPVSYARPIAQPKDLKLAGSSSEFRPPSDGNVHVPLGRRAPGLYVVEAVAGRHRAVTLLFVSDTMAVTKTSQNQFFVWAAQRAGGRPVAAQMIWTDLNGVLGSGSTDGDGVLIVDHVVPETSYAFGVDAQGGVFVTENFYYDSEIHNDKLYAYTDRPLYRPGDQVHLRVYGREFRSATESRPIGAGDLALTVFDASGSPFFQQKLRYHPEDGASTGFALPDEAPSGGYEIRLRRGDDEYGASFRVAAYVKPHFEVLIEPAQATYRTGQPIGGRLRLAYPDGKPVAGGRVTLSARAQQLSMVEGDLVYGGAFPVQIDNNQELTTDARGEVSFALPAAREPSRLVLTVLATDGAAQRVRASRELLIERAAASWRLRPQRQFAAPGQTMRWTLTADESGAPTAPPTRWVAIHQQTQTRTEGAIKIVEGAIKAGEGAADSATDRMQPLDLTLSRPGSYTIELRDAGGNLLGAAPFWVSGGELKPPRGTIEIVLDKPRYRAGEVARALITFPEPVDDALLTLERDRVERHGRLASPGSLARLRRIGDRQWEAELDVRAEHAPNITLSVAYVAQGEFGFQNAGIVVRQPSIDVVIRSDKPVYAPGDTAVIDLRTRDGTGQPIAAVLSVAVVDEMVYALQPELAPSVQEFFNHPRRNNVRTHSSQAFISYDEAGDSLSPSPIRRRQNDRAIKLLERPRRDERDTALFAPVVRTDAQGHAQVRFVVPDALTRWRISAKAYGRDRADGLVGERRAWIGSDQPIFAKWTSPDWARIGDRPQVSAAIFNQTQAAMPLTVSFAQGAEHREQKLMARPGANYVSFAMPPVAGDADARIEVRGADGQVLDKLATRMRIRAPQWLSEHEVLVDVPAGTTVSLFELPADAREIRARLVSPGASAWSRIADALIDYPYGCTEQTASRLLPLSYAVQALGGDAGSASPLRRRLYSARLRLASMAGPEAVFGWWSRGTADSLMLSAYAYFADHQASKVLGIELPPENWQRLLEIYRDRAAREPVAQRAWALWLMHRIGLPTATLTDGLISALIDARARAVQAPLTPTGWFSPLDHGSAGFDLALALSSVLAREDGRRWPEALQEPLQRAWQRLDASDALLAQAMRVSAGRDTAQGAALLRALARTSVADPTIDRALSLALMAHAQGIELIATTPALVLPLEPRPASASAQDNAWAEQRSAGGHSEFVPQGGASATVPRRIEWREPAAAPAQLSIRYRSGDAAGMVPLAAGLQRRLMRLVRDGDRFRAEPVSPGAALSTEDLYLDQIDIDAREPLAYALVELALPPGAMLETATWGIALADPREAGKSVPFERAVGEAGAGGYTVPIDALGAGQHRTVRHLVRFGQRGEFNLPSARLWSMYQPQRQAREAGAPLQQWRLP